MSVNVAVASKVPIFLNVGDGNSTLFIRAKVVNEQGNEVSQSPITLYNEGNGQYSHNDYIMPDVPFINVIYDVFRDSSFSEKAYYYSVTESFAKIKREGDNDYLSGLPDGSIAVEVDSITDEIDVLIGKK